MIKKLFSITILVAFLFSSTPAYADEAMRSTVNDAMYGGLIGLLIGGAFMALSDEPEDHWNYLLTGGALGVLGGVAYGVATKVVQYDTYSLIEADGDEAKLNMPTIQAGETFDENLDETDLVFRADILRYRF